MKKWLALLLAILMVASLAACTKKGEQKEDEPIDVPVDEPVVEKNPFQTVDELVYTVQNDAKLYKESNFTTESLVLPKAATELHRIQISVEDGASVVEYKAQYYYIKSALLTTADLYGKAYKKMEAPKTMYAKTNGMKVLSCADDSLAEVKTTLSKNDEVQVVAEGNGWCKIHYAKGNLSGDFFVKSTDLSAEQEVDYSKLDFSEYFTSANEQKTVLANVNLRIAPVVAAGTSANGLSLKKGDTVTIVAYGTGKYASWGIVLYRDEVKPGDAQTYSRYYVKLCSEDCTEAYIVVPARALKNRIEELKFKAGSETLYVNADKLNLRFAPSLTALYAGELAKSKAVEVVASGSVTEPDPDNLSENVTLVWAMVKDGERYVYASKKYLSGEGSLINENGALTLEQLQKKYPQLRLIEEIEIKVTDAVVNCKYEPDNTKDSGVTLKANDKVTLVAEVTVDDATWFVFKVEEGSYYCAGKEQFEKVVLVDPTQETEQQDEQQSGEGGSQS
ncbi:MAG: hypothetical protein IJR88_01010 [Clostridia bacterium]|nr:hypothetical protein [Clostridia bacterium]